MLAKQTISLIAAAEELSVPLMPDGVAAFDSSGDLIAVEAAGTCVEVIDTRAWVIINAFDAGVESITAIAIRGNRQIAIGGSDGMVVVHDLRSGRIEAEMSVGEQAIVALAYSPFGGLLAIADAGGVVVISHTSPGGQARQIDTGEEISAIAVPDSGSPILLGTSDGWVRVLRRVLAPKEVPWIGAAVTSLAFPLRPTGMPVIGRADGAIAKLDPGYQQRSSFAPPSGGPVRALWAGPLGQVKAITGDGLLGNWMPQRDASSILYKLPRSWQPGGEQVLEWGRELVMLLQAFGSVREQMRDEIVADRAEMLDQLGSLDETERERIRPAVIDSAEAIFDSYAFDLAVRRIAGANPLPGILIGCCALWVMAMVLSSLPVAAFWHLDWVQRGGFAGMLIGGIWVLRRLGRLGKAGRTLRVLAVVAGLLFAKWGTQATLSEPLWLRHVTAGWLPQGHAGAVRLSVPYPVWLALAYVVGVSIGIAVLRFLVANARAPSAVVRRRRVLGGSLLHALLAVAYKARLMEIDPEMAASPRQRASLYRLIRQAAAIADREWVNALRTRERALNRIIRTEGSAISTAIRRWERPAALAGTQLPHLSSAFAVAVVNAADSDWQALAGDTTEARVPRRHRAWKLASQLLAVAVPLGIAAGIVLGVHPLPQTLSAALIFLVGLSVSRVLRWLDFSDDIDPALTVSELLTKPK